MKWDGGGKNTIFAASVSVMKKKNNSISCRLPPPRHSCHCLERLVGQDAFVVVVVVLFGGGGLTSAGFS